MSESLTCIGMGVCLFVGGAHACQLCSQTLLEQMCHFRGILTLTSCTWSLTNVPALQLVGIFLAVDLLLIAVEYYNSVTNGTPFAF